MRDATSPVVPGAVLSDGLLATSADTWAGVPHEHGRIPEVLLTFGHGVRDRYQRFAERHEVRRQRAEAGHGL